MRIHWAVFGEVKKGHDLMAASGEAAFAAKVTQYTDRSGDPPHGLNWGPVASGFPLGDRYVFLQTQPDPSAGRAGMVRSHAALVPLAELGRLNNVAVLFARLLPVLGKPDATLEPLDIPDEVLLQIPAANSQSGLVSLAFCLGAAETEFPLVWTSVEPYLPAVAALWGRLPVTLRPVFAFAFQFAPELRLPVTPTLIATAPVLANRWPTAQLLPLHPPGSVKFDTAQSWLAGLPEGSVFSDVLERFDIEVTQFNKLGLLASFADLVAKLPQVSFSEAKRAVNIVAHHGRPTASAAVARAALFDRMCKLVPGASAEDLLGLRNLNAVALADLVPSLEKAMEEWIAGLPSGSPWSSAQLSLLEHAVTKPATWWSAPFADWLKAQAKGPDSTGAPRLVGLFVSAPLSEFLTKALPATKAAETLMVDALPEKLAVPHADQLLGLAEKRRWMRLHARALLCSRPGPEAIILHAQVAGEDDAGIAELHAALGTGALIQAAGETGEPLLLRFAGRILAAPDTDFATTMPLSCTHRLAVLQEALFASDPPLPGPLRVALQGALVDPAGGEATVVELCLACAERHPDLLLELPDPAALFERLPPAAERKVSAALNRFVQQEVVAGRSFRIAEPEAVKGLLDTDGVVRALAGVGARDGAKLGANAFRGLSFLTDDQCGEWLIDLFKRTQYQPLTGFDCMEIAALLGDGNYPHAARIVRETVEQFHRRDVAPIHERIRYTYQLAKAYQRSPTPSPAAARLPKVIIATALPLEREAVMRYLADTSYDPKIFADVAPWPAQHPLFEIYVFTTGAGNMSALTAMLRASNQGVTPMLAFFVGVCGGVKDSAIGDVVYSTKVYSYEGGKEEDGAVKARPTVEHTADALVQLAHRVAAKDWQPEHGAGDPAPKASPAVIASGELVFASRESTAANFQLLRSAYNDTQVVDMEGYGFMKAMRDTNVKLAMVVRGVSDAITGKCDDDAKGNQPLAMRNAAAFLFALLRDCERHLISKKKKKKGLLSFLKGDDNS